MLLLVSGFSVFGAPIGGEVLPQSIASPTWFGEPSPFWYGVFGLTITYGAYMAEVYRAGIESVPGGQMEAARSLGMSHGQAMRYVIVPQAVRRVIPPLLNDFIALMKDTSLVSVLGLVEVVQAGRDIQSDTFNGSGLTMGAILFLIVTIPLARLVDWLIARERRRTGRSGGDDGGDRGRRAGRSGTRRWRRGDDMSDAPNPRAWRGDAARSRASASASASSRCCAGSISRSSRARSSACSARAARASRRCCAASTCWSRRRAAGS